LRPRGIVVAIDGPSGAGKSTMGRALADRLGYTYIDTGAMYRALALKALARGLPLDSDHELTTLAEESTIELADGGRRVLLDGRDVTPEIRSREVSSAASQVSVHAGVRRSMVARQRAMGREGGVVLDGRDIGTAVFPDAEAKIYLDADPRQRARRRHAELAAAGTTIPLDAVEREVRDRDHTDTNREESPLLRADDATLVDSTALNPDAVLDLLLAIVRGRAEASIDVGALAAVQAESGPRYLELVRASSLSVGLYHLVAGATDAQGPHGEDEVYYTLSGSARLKVGDVDQAVGPGSLHFVAARVRHQFHSIESDLTLLVFFAPAEGSTGGAAGS
jgi:CMP/dCMP kinase